MLFDLLEDGMRAVSAVIPAGLLFAPVRIVALPLAIVANIAGAMRQNAEIKRRIERGEIKVGLGVAHGKW